MIGLGDYDIDVNEWVPSDVLAPRPSDTLSQSSRLPSMMFTPRVAAGLRGGPAVGEPQAWRHYPLPPTLKMLSPHRLLPPLLLLSASKPPPGYIAFGNAATPLTIHSTLDEDTPDSNVASPAHFSTASPAVLTDASSQLSSAPAIPRQRLLSEPELELLQDAHESAADSSSVSSGASRTASVLWGAIDVWAFRRQRRASTLSDDDDVSAYSFSSPVPLSLQPREAVASDTSDDITSVPEPLDAVLQEVDSVVLPQVCNLGIGILRIC